MGWYARSARDLPWRAPNRTAWGVLVSEVMLQQTPVARVEPAWLRWMARWPDPAALAEAPVSEPIRAWQGLGYPRRAVRLHATATVITEEHGGEVPRGLAELRRLPGVGDYTAAAVHAFAYGGTVAVLDTNVRRVLARWLTGSAFPASVSVSLAEQHMARSLLPADGQAPLWSVAVMELGALVCRADRPNCDDCPLRRDCAWLAAGRPAGNRPRSQPAYVGSDRQARGFVLRSVAAGPRSITELEDAWQRISERSSLQARRAVESLAADGLIEVRDSVACLPGL